MSRQEAFLQAIREDPDDEELRLVFADWLEEQGDPRGELFRVQCERSKLLDSIELRYYSLEERNKEILAEHREKWLGEPPERLPVQFENGMLAVGLTLENLKRPEVQSWIRRQEPWITQLELLPDDDEDLEQMLAHELLQNTRWLLLFYSDVTSAGLSALPNLSQLRTLVLDSVYGADEDVLDAIAQLNHLTRLEIMETPFSNEGMSKLPSLSGLRYFRAHDVGSEGLVYLSHLKRLKQLFLHVEPLAGDDLGALTELPELHELSLSFRELNANGIRHLNQIPSLRSLSLEGPISDKVLQELGRSAQIEKLSLQFRSEVSAGCFKHLASLKARELTLNAYSLRDAGLEHLAAMEHLELLDLGDTNLGSSELRSFNGMSKLRALSLYGNPISGKAIRHLASLPLLESLKLRETRVNNDAIPFLIEMPSLQWLDLRKTKVNGKGLEALKEARPDLSVLSGK